MATVFEADDHRFEIGRVFSRAFSAIGRNAGTYVMLAVVLQFLPALLLPLVRGATGGSALIGLFLSLLTFYFALSLNGALIRATILDGAGQPADFGTSIRTGLRVALPLLGIAILFGLAVGFASLLLLVPGMILVTVWAVVFPAYVAESPGIFGAFGRSAQLTKGERWKIFGLIVVGYLIVFIPIGLMVSFAGGFAAYVAAQATGLSGLIVVASVINLITVVVFTAIQAALYIELRQAKEGTSASTLAQVFA